MTTKEQYDIFADHKREIEKQIEDIRRARKAGYMSESEGLERIMRLDGESMVISRRMEEIADAAPVVGEKKFATRIGYSDCYPYEITRIVSLQTLEIRPMDSEIDPDWKPEFHVGGFAAHCSNQSEQRWIYSSREDAEPIRIRLRKNGRWYDSHGSRYSLGFSPCRFYDYNY